MTQNQKIIFNKLNKIEKQQLQLEKKIGEFILDKDWYKVILILFIQLKFITLLGRN